MKSYTPEEAPEMMVIRDYAPFYSRGPMQHQGPDATLRVDSRVKLQRQEFGYSFVQLEDGRQGYIPSEVLAPAPPRPPAPPESRESGRRSSSSSSSRGEYLPDPVFDDTPLPDLPALEEIPLEVPPPILLDDEAPAGPPSFRL